jgi:hypothetical protein
LKTIAGIQGELLFTPEDYENLKSLWTVTEVEMLEMLD